MFGTDLAKAYMMTQVKVMKEAHPQFLGPHLHQAKCHPAHFKSVELPKLQMKSLTTEVE